jgi:hypothetical protein
LKTAERQTTKCTKETKDNNFRILGVLGALGGEFALQISKQVWASDELVRCVRITGFRY